MRIYPSVLPLFFLGLASFFGEPRGVALAATQTIVMENMKYAPETLEIHSGDSVIWVNKDFLSHTATAENKSFNSGEIKPGASWGRKFKTPGKISYKCLYHPLMKATLTIAK